jgi:hypothetical protein
MSIATLKKKTQSANYRNHSNAVGGFSLNSARRIDSHKGQQSSQTMMRGTGFKSAGIRGPIVPILSQYVNYDIEGVPRPTNKNTRAYLSYKLKWLSGGYPKNVVKSTERMDYETYMAKLHLFKERDAIPRSTCLDNVAVSKDLSPSSYEIYQKTKLLERNCLPLKNKDLHYPPAYQCNSARSACHENTTYEEFLDLVSCTN